MEQLLLKRIGGSLYLRIPPRFIHRHNLSEGDTFFLVPVKLETVFKLIKTDAVAGELAGADEMVTD
jgi:antitoxin component of MazEF toxin-antitoxin module